MNPTLEKAWAQVRTAPEEHHEGIAHAMLDALERERIRDASYAAYVQDGIEQGEADIAAGRVRPLDEGLAKLLGDFDTRNA